MSYIGRGISNLASRTKLDSITASSTATYNLLLNSVAYVPSSAESLTVSLNGIIQSPQSSYTVSGSTIVFASNLASSDVINFILAERAITLTTIGSGTVTTSNIVDANVTTAKIADNAVTSAKLASGLALGKIGQVVQVTDATTFSTTSSSYVDVTGVTASITPTATSSKVLVMIQGSTNNSTASSELNRLKLLRGSTAIGVANTTHDSFFNTYGVSNVAISFTTLLLDSPATTSSATYKLQVKQSGSSTAYVGGFGPGSEAITTLTLMEVLA